VLSGISGMQTEVYSIMKKNIMSFEDILEIGEALLVSIAVAYILSILTNTKDVEGSRSNE